MGMDNVLHIIMNNDFMIFSLLLLFSGFVLFSGDGQSSFISILVKRQGSAMPPKGSFVYFGHSTNGSSVTRTDVKVSVNHPQQQQQPQ